MSRTPKHHPTNFKAKVAWSDHREDATISELALQYGVYATVIHHRKREALVSLEADFSGKFEKNHIDQEVHIHELLAKIGQLSVEQVFLSIPPSNWD